MKLIALLSERISIKKKWMILEFKQGLKDLDIIIYLFFIISQDYYELSKKTIRCNGNIFHVFKPNKFRDVLIFYQDKSSMDMTLNEFKLLTSSCWNEKYQPLTIDMTKVKYTGRCRLGLNSIIVPNKSPF